MDRILPETARARLARLWQRAQDEMERIEFASPGWMPEPQRRDGRPVADVIIVGAGMSGLAIAFGLRRRGIGNVRVIDRAPAGQEGPWITCARMKTLRSPKTRTGPDLGVPSLTPQAWFVARYGEAAWESCERMSRADWMAYLTWFRDTVGIAVESETELTDLAPAGSGLVALDLKTSEGTERAHARRVVLATGMDGAGGPRVPGLFAALPKHFWTHSAETCDDSHLRGKRVAVIGSATSAFDWADAALDQGAASVTLLSRGHAFPRHEILLFTHFPGYLGHFQALPDAERWRFNRLSQTFKVPPTQDQYDRAVADPRFAMVFDAPVTGCRVEGDAVRLDTPKGTLLADHLLLGTGYVEADLRLRPELGRIAETCTLWRDRYSPPPEDADAGLGRFPYLSEDFAFVPRGAGAEWLRRVHLFTYGAAPSVGPVSNGITGMKYGVPRMVEALVAAFFREDAAFHARRMAAYDAPRFDPHLETLSGTVREALT
ncbi:NAD(P)/FAD-dependent oxidoreductase [Salipiger sp. P9]|uniref:NAD(P)-binding domain-containing protein n=1 Tax=Salipiger pentaromativorans TaxID=2943193 RepID=UPI0021572889|nr:NAD(P)/FAD-dependent oxidoreductase [Salipiger pentaromativorans]MCR8546891.1 NAD(P)/FAD-dependent oxidoreductase [Salipiger pentaromativorans]